MRRTRTHPPNTNSISNTTTATTTPSTNPTRQSHHLPSPQAPPPLHGVHVCLTGFTPQRKQQLHDMVRRLGGTYAGDFNSSKTTHLIAASPTGAKYAAASKFLSSSSSPPETKKRSTRSPSSSSSSSSSCRIISIVTPSWIESCVAHNVRVSESCHELVLPGRKKTKGAERQQQQQQQQQQRGGRNEDPTMRDDEETSSLIAQCHNLLSSMEERRRRDDDAKSDLRDDHFGIFWNCGFYFVGLNETQRTLLSRIVRKEYGVRYWTMTDEEQVDYIIVGDDESNNNEEENDAVWWWDKHSTNHFDYDGGGPFIVTPSWIISSVRMKCCQDERDYFPSPRRSIRRRRTITPEAVDDYDDETIVSQSRLFQGAIFIIDSSLDALTTTNDDGSNNENGMTNPLWDPTHLRQLVISHGGHMLCRKTIKSLSRRPSPTTNDDDDDGNGTSSSRRRICYILTTRATHPPSTHPLLPSLSPHCTLLSVSPLWLETTIRSSVELSPSSFPLFAPFFPHSPLSGTVSLTGFVGWERTAVAVAIEALGGVYSDCLKKSHDYLICKEVPGTGPKYDKAVSWGCVEVVGLDWLVRVAREGCGEEEEEEEDATVRRGKNGETNDGVAAVKEEEEEEEETARIGNVDDDRVATVEEEEQLRKNLDDMLRRPLSLSSSQGRTTDKKSRHLQKRRRSSFVPPTAVKKRKRVEGRGDDDDDVASNDDDDDDDETTMNGRATTTKRRRIGGEKEEENDDDDDDDDDDEKGSSMEDSQAIWFAAERATQLEHSIV